MVARPPDDQHEPMQDGPIAILRASAIALFFVGLAVLVALVSLLVAAFDGAR
jgi:hypothetical protein